MVLDAVENCLKAIENYKIDAATRTGKPNAFSYFTQISFYAFLRRIAKEKKQADIRKKLIMQGGIDMFATSAQATYDPIQLSSVANYVDTLRLRIDNKNDQDSAIKEFAKEEKKKEKTRKVRLADSNLEEFIDDE
jgi:hypothetical protein